MNNFHSDLHRDLFYMFIITFFSEPIDEESLLSFSNPFDRTVSAILDLFPCDYFEESDMTVAYMAGFQHGNKLKPLEDYERK